MTYLDNPLIKVLKIGFMLIFRAVRILFIIIFIWLVAAFIEYFFFHKDDDSLLFATEAAFVMMEDKCSQYGCNPNDFQLIKRGPCGGWELWLESSKNEGFFSRVTPDGDGFVLYYPNIPKQPIFNCEEEPFLRLSSKNSERLPEPNHPEIKF